MAAWEAHHNVAQGNLNNDEQAKVLALQQVRVFIHRETFAIGQVQNLSVADLEVLHPLLARGGPYFQALGAGVVQYNLNARRTLSLAIAAPGLPAADTVDLARLAPTHNDAALATFAAAVVGGVPANRLRIVAAAVPGLAAAEVVSLMGLHATHNNAQIVTLANGAPAIATGLGGGRNAAHIVTMATRIAPAQVADIVAFMSAAAPVTGTATPQDNFAGRSANSFGVAERLNLAAAIVPNGLTGTNIGGLQWDVPTGGGAIGAAVPATGAGFYTNDGTVGATRLRLRIVNAPYAGLVVQTIDRTAVAPNNALMTQQAGQLHHRNGQWSAGFYGEIWLRPTNVSFNRVQFSEGVGNVAANGYLADFNGTAHAQGVWCTLTNGNAATGNRVNGTDTVRAAKPPPPPPFAIGQLDWPINWQYRVPPGPPHIFTVATHSMTADATGRATVSKKGAGPFARNVGDPTYWP